MNQNGLRKQNSEDLPDINTFKKQVYSDFNLILDVTDSVAEKAKVSFKTFVQLFENAKKLKSKNENLTTEKNYSENLNAKQEKEIQQLKQKINQISEEILVEKKLHSELKVSQTNQVKTMASKIKQLEITFSKQAKDSQDKNSRLLEFHFKDRFMVLSPLQKTNAPESDRLNFEKNAQQKQIELLTANLKKMYSFVKKLNKAIFDQFSVRKEFISQFFKIEEGKSAVFKELAKIKVDKLDVFDSRLPDQFHSNLKNFLIFSNQFDELQNEDFRVFLKRKNCFKEGKDDIKMEDVYKAKNLAKVKEVIEMQNLLETYQELIKGHEAFCQDKLQDSEEEDVYQKDQDNGDLEEVEDYLRLQEEYLESYRNKKTTMDSEIEKELEVMVRKIQKHL